MATPVEYSDRCPNTSNTDIVQDNLGEPNPPNQYLFSAYFKDHSEVLVSN